MTMADSTLALVVDARCTLGEGILWSSRRRALLWTDIERSQLWMYSALDESTESWRLPDRLGCFAIGDSGRLLLGLAKGLAIADLDAARGPELAAIPVVPVEPDLPTRINDGRTDRSGNFVFGTMDETEGHPATGSFYQYSTRHGLRRLDLGRIGIANSICFSADGGTMYYCDSQSRVIMQCDYDADDAQTRNAREFVRFVPGQGSPDGSVIDADGCLWNAAWGAAVVRRFTPDGRLDREIALPPKNLTCVAFGGDGLDRLYVTSARQEMSDDELARCPEAGSVYSVTPGVRGLPDVLFRDA
ncbi:MAG: SMP-30/gluconolactonase/LRE family protein [Acidobacteriota bacterium]